jgi:hypothetical protein
MEIACVNVWNECMKLVSVSSKRGLVNTLMNPWFCGKFRDKLSKYQFYNKNSLWVNFRVTTKKFLFQPGCNYLHSRAKRRKE